MTTHAERRIVPYTPGQMFDLVADVEHYPDFLPWCLAARIRQRQENEFDADVLIGFKMVREKFTSHVKLDRPGRIDVQYSEGPFHHLTNRWLFSDEPGGCLIDFYVDFEFRNKMLQTLIGFVFTEAVRRMVVSFEGRAAQLYGAGAEVTRGHR